MALSLNHENTSVDENIFYTVWKLDNQETKYLLDLIRCPDFKSYSGSSSASEVISALLVSNGSPILKYNARYVYYLKYLNSIKNKK